MHIRKDKVYTAVCDALFLFVSVSFLTVDLHQHSSFRLFYSNHRYSVVEIITSMSYAHLGEVCGCKHKGKSVL